MKKKDLYFIALIIGVLGLFTFLWAVSRKPPDLSARAEHAGMNKDTPGETCFQCHAPIPVRPEHTGMTRATARATCLECHKPEQLVMSPMPQHHPKKGLPGETRPTPCAVCHKPQNAPAAALLLSAPTTEDHFRWLNQQGR
jgi:hypothetical protein